MPPFDAQKHSPIQNLNRFTELKVDQGLDLLAKSVPCSVEEVDSTGTIVTVKVEIQDPDVVFPLIKCPVYGPEWVRWPLKKGDKGVMFSADYYIGAMSGLGTGVADLTPQWNLSTGVFFPIGNTNFSDTDDPDKVVIYGPKGVIIKGCNDGEQHTDTDPGPEVGTRANVPAVPDPCGAIDVSKDGVTNYGQGDEAGNYTTIDKEGFKVFINGELTFIVDGAGMRWVAGNPIPGGGNYGINVTPTGTHIDDVNFLPHVHRNVTPGTGNSGDVNNIISPAE